MLKKLLTRIGCLIGRHPSFTCIQVFESQGSKRIRCDHCGKELVLNYQIKSAISWSSTTEEFYRLIGNRIIDPKFSDGSPLNFFSKSNN